MEEVEPAEVVEDEPALPGIFTKTVGAVPTYNEKHDAPTIWIDSVQGAMLTNHGVKISFVEHFLTDELDVRGRYVVNLAMAAPQMRAVGHLFVKLAEDMDTALSADAANAG